MRIAKPLIAALLLTAGQGCATLLDGKTDRVSFITEPPGAEITVDGATIVSPGTLEVRKKTDSAMVRFPGGEAFSVELKRKFQFGYFLLDVLLTPGYGLSGVLVDMASGAIYAHPATVRVDLAELRRQHGRSEDYDPTVATQASFDRIDRLLSGS